MNVEWTRPADLSNARSWARHNFLGTTLVTLWLSVTCPVKSDTNQHSELQDMAVMLKYCYANYARQHLTSTLLHNHQTTLFAFVARLDLVWMQAKTSFSSWWGGSLLTSFPGEPFRKPFRRTHSLWWRCSTSGTGEVFSKSCCQMRRQSLQLYYWGSQRKWMEMPPFHCSIRFSVNTV